MLVEQSAMELERFYSNKGYVHADVSTTIDTTRHKKAVVTYHIKANDPYRIRNYTMKFPDPKIDSLAHLKAPRRSPLALSLIHICKPMKRETDLIAVWFDSGAMPYAQITYPFENLKEFDNRQIYPADFIAEGVDQTRGWFFTLHALGTMIFDSVAYKAVVSNGLVLDKNGNKMSKRLGNAVDPLSLIHI